MKLALGVAKGMDYLAEVGYVHRVSWKAAVVIACTCMLINMLFCII